MPFQIELMDRLQRRHLLCKTPDPSSSLRKRKNDLELIRASFAKPEDEATKTTAAFWLSFLGEDEAIEALLQGIKGKVHPATTFVRSNPIPPLSQYSPFVEYVIDCLDPSHEDWEYMVQVAGIQRLAEARPRLRELYLAQNPVPSVNRILYWLHETEIDDAMLNATFAYLDPATDLKDRHRPWSELKYFLDSDTTGLRDRCFAFLKDVGTPPINYGFNYSYSSYICRHGGEEHVDELVDLLQAGERLNGSPIEALARILGPVARPHLLAGLANEAWQTDSANQLGTIFKDTKDTEIGEALEHALYKGDLASHSFKVILEALLAVGGNHAKKVVTANVAQLGARKSMGILWELDHLTLSDLATLLEQHDLPTPDSLDQFRAETKKSFGTALTEAALATELLEPLTIIFDTESDELPNHQLLLNRISETLSPLGLGLKESTQTANLIDEDDWIQDYEASFVMAETTYSFSGQTKGDWYDADGVLNALSKAISATRPNWSLRALNSSGQEAVSLVAPDDVHAELTSRFHLAYWTPPV